MHYGPAFNIDWMHDGRNKGKIRINKDFPTHVGWMDCLAEVLQPKNGDERGYDGDKRREQMSSTNE